MPTSFIEPGFERCIKIGKLQNCQHSTQYPKCTKNAFIPLAFQRWDDYGDIYFSLAKLETTFTLFNNSS